RNTCFLPLVSYIFLICKHAPPFSVCLCARQLLVLKKSLVQPNLLDGQCIPTEEKFVESYAFETARIVVFIVRDCCSSVLECGFITHFPQILGLSSFFN